MTENETQDRLSYLGTGILIGFVIGGILHSFVTQNLMKEAVRAGAAYWTVDEIGDVKFNWIKNAN